MKAFPITRYFGNILVSSLLFAGTIAGTFAIWGCDKNPTSGSPSDDITWTARSSGTTNELLSVIWTGPSTGSASSPQAGSGTGQLVAVGDGGTILTSPDGVTWTHQTSGTTNDLSSVTWTGSQFVAVSDYPGNGVILTSPDGVTWTARNSGTDYLYSVTWTGPSTGSASSPQAGSGTGQLVAVGDAGVLTSPDGVTWTVRNLEEQNFPVSVTWTGSKLVVVGFSAVPPYTSTILTSSDGMTWTGPSSGRTMNPLFSVTWTGTQLVAVGDSGAIATSPDGVIWTKRTSGTTNVLLFVTWTGTQLLALSGNRPTEQNPNISPVCTILTSPDGVTWTARNSGTPNYVLNSVTSTGTQLVAVGVDGVILTSPK